MCFFSCAEYLLRSTWMLLARLDTTILAVDHKHLLILIYLEFAAQVLAHGLEKAHE